MFNYVLVSLGGGVLFGILDGVINANPLAQQLLEAYKPIARTSVNAPVGIMIDLFYGFVMAAIFLVLRRSLPGTAGWTKGLSFGLLAWFFRAVMGAASQWIMFNVPATSVLYSTLAGLVEMLLLGLFFGWGLHPTKSSP
jgi:hypothetical protein